MIKHLPGIRVAERCYAGESPQTRNWEVYRSMNTNVRDADGFKVVNVVGIIDTNTAPDLERRLDELAQDGATKILLNFEKLVLTTSAGLRVLLVCAKKMKGSGGQFGVCSLNDTIQEVFDISGFSSLLNVFPTEQEAIDGMGA